MEQFGGWAMAKTTYDFIRKLLPEGKTILEIGSGFGTGQLAKYYKMYSIEANHMWVNSYDSTYLYVPVKKYNETWTSPSISGNTAWHDPYLLKEKLIGINYDLIFIDGPEGKYGRGGFLKHIDLFNTNVPMVFDDVNRPPERVLLEKVSGKLNKPYIILEDRVTGAIL